MRTQSQAGLSCHILAVLLSLAFALEADEIHTAAAGGAAAKIKALLREDPTLINLGDTNKATPLHYAARNGQVEALEVLLSAGADLEIRNKDQHSPLYCALHNGQVETARILLERGARFSEADAHGSFPWHLALLGKKTQLIEMLMDKGANVNAPHPTNRITLLHMATRDNQVEIVRFLLEHKADVNAADSTGDTALHYAAQGGRLECAELLIAKGANPNAANKLGFRPFDLIKGKENDRLAEFLQQRTATRWEATGTGKVGEVGDPSLLVLEGNSSYPTKAIRDALSSSASYLLAAHPQAQLKPFLAVLEQKILGGYQRGGFPDPKVSASYDDRAGRVRARIEEGRQLKCGVVRVKGVERPIADLLRERFTAWPRRGPGAPSWAASIAPGKQAADSELAVEIKVELESGVKSKQVSQPLWEPGKPARFDPGAIDEIRLLARTCLAEAGFWFPTIRIDRLPDTGGGTADLELEITRIGPPGKIMQIEVSGNRQNSRAAILSYLGLRSGKKVTRQLVETVHQRLWSSARFLDWTISAQPVSEVDSPAGGVCLCLAVREHEPAPTLDARLTREEQALVKCAEWLGGFVSRSEDLVADFSSSGEDAFYAGRGRLVLSPNRGAFVEVAPARPGLPDYSLLFAERLMGVYARNRGYKFEVKDPDLLTEASVQLLPTPAGDSNRWNFNFGGSFQRITDLSGEGGSTPPFQLQMMLAPVVFLTQARDHLDDCRWRGNVLTLGTSNLSLRVDARTGRLNELSVTDESTVSVRFEKGAFEKARRELTGDTSSYRNRFAEHQLLGSFYIFTAVEFLRARFYQAQQRNLSPAQIEQASNALEKILAIDLFARIEPDGDVNRTNALFNLPVDEIDLALARNSLAALYSGFAFHYCDQLFPKYSWPWTVAREAAFVLASQGRYVNAELERLAQSDDTGPIGYLVVARLLSTLDPSAAKAFALRGLTRLTADDFLRDCQLFLKGDAGLARGFADLVANVRALSDQELEALGIALGPTDSKILKRAVEDLRRNPAQPLNVTLAPALEQLWDEHLRSVVRAELQKLAFARGGGSEPTRL